MIANAHIYIDYKDILIYFLTNSNSMVMFTCTCSLLFQKTILQYNKNVELWELNKLKNLYVLTTSNFLYCKTNKVSGNSISILNLLSNGPAGALGVLLYLWFFGGGVFVKPYIKCSQHAMFRICILFSTLSSC